MSSRLKAVMGSLVLIGVAGLSGCSDPPAPPAVPNVEQAVNAPGDPGMTGAAGGTAQMISNQTMELACGVCIYKMPGVEGCPLAIMIDGKPYLVEGATWPNHDYCDRKCQAVVTGKLEGDPRKFVATSVEPTT